MTQTTLPDSFNWCLSTLGCAELDLEASLSLAATYGIGALELRALEDALDLPAYFGQNFGSPENLCKKIAQSKVRIAVLDTSLKLIDSDTQDREAFLKFIPWAEAMGTPYLRVFDGGSATVQGDKSQLDKAAETVNWWQKLRAHNGWQVDIAMETHDAICSAKDCLAFEARLDAPCPLIWDAHHTFHKAGEDISETWGQIRPYVKHIHFKDSTVEANEVNDYTLALPGEGRFPLIELFRLLLEDGYNACVCLEWERKWQPQAAPITEALDALATLLRDLLR